MADDMVLEQKGTPVVTQEPPPFVPSTADLPPPMDDAQVRAAVVALEKEQGIARVFGGQFVPFLLDEDRGGLLHVRSSFRSRASRWRINRHHGRVIGVAGSLVGDANPLHHASLGH